MHKFQRNYRCEFEIGDQDISGNRTPKHNVTVAYPFTLQFSITRNAYSECNTAQMRFFNLDSKVQALLWRDMYQASKYVQIKLYAGYGDNMPLIFQGLTQKCNSYRQSGATEVITEIQANDMSYLFQYGFVDATLSKDTKANDLFTSLLEEIPDIQVGFISDDVAPLKRDTTYFGQTMDVITRDYSKYQIFIDNGNLHVLGERDIIPSSENYVVTANSGLLGSPIRSDTTIELDMLFEPGITVGQAIVLRTDTLENLNGTYKVIGMNHNGMISPVACDSLITHLSLKAGNDFKVLKKGSESLDFPVGGQGWIRPVASNITITSPYGMRWHPIDRVNKMHYGIDYGCPMNTVVKATQDGIVTEASMSHSALGRAIFIGHGKLNNKNVSSVYAHLNKLNVVYGQKVSKGDIIGYSGSTGKATGPHLHFEIRENNLAVNPNKYIGG